MNGDLSTGGPRVTKPFEYERGSETARRQLSRHLVGQGIELGPGPKPFPALMPSTTVGCLDAWAPNDNADRFPEIEQSEFAPPDIICDFNVEGLAPIEDGSQDFAVASHVLEHVANPLHMLCELHRVLRPGGTALIILPDRHNTFDRHRPPTPLAHLVEEFEAGVTEVDDAHIEEFISFTAVHPGGGPPGTSSVPDENLDLESMSVYERSLALLWLRWDDVKVPAQRRELIELHRKRSIHAHVWDVDEFLPMVRHGVLQLGHAWQFVDGLLPGDPGGRPDEFALVLRRDVSPRGCEQQAERLQAAWDIWRGYRDDLRAEMEHLREALAGSEDDNAALRAEVAELEQSAQELERSREELRRAVGEAVGVLHRLGQGRGLAPEEILTVRRQPGGEAVPDLIELLLRYRNHPFQEGTRRSLGKVKRTALQVLRSGRPLR